MRVQLFDFQQDALTELQTKLAQARMFASIDNPQAISFSAPTGSGKTIVMTALFESILFGDENLAPQPDAAILWISDMPELNEQTRLKVESKSNRIRVRQLTTIDSDFDAERLAGGHIYFINTQKLGADKLLTRKGDTRQYTLWETLTNTAKAIPDRFYLVIDEAHRGMQRPASEVRRARTILQKFLLGSPEDGLCRMPLVLGMTATPRRFEELLAGTAHTVHKVYVTAEEVRASGLLKDRILIHFPEATAQTEMTLLAQATNRWQIMERRWSTYCHAEEIERVRPILVIQVEDGTEKSLTRTDLRAALATLESAIGRLFSEGEVAHSFHETGEISAGNYRIRHIDASRIEEDPKVNVILFKMNLSTGWDCPRAEVMMSFRRAHDHTYIAQLLGRMVRTPLAHRVEKDAVLNDVHLYLPHYNEESVEAVIQDLQNVEDVPPTETVISRESVTLDRREGSEAIFKAMQNLVTYRVGAARKQSTLRRLMGLGRGLTHDRIDETAQQQVTQTIVGWMSEQVGRLQAAPDFQARAAQITGVDLKTITLHGTVAADEKASYTVDAAREDIERHFMQAERRLSNGLNIEYWKANEERDATIVKTEAIVLSEDHEALQTLENNAEKEFDRLYEEHKLAIANLKEQRRQHYEKLRLATAKPSTISWVLPETIAFRRTPSAPTFEKHLYLENDGLFRADLGSWERGVLNEELANDSVIVWLRNMDRQKWSLEIPYRDAGQIRPMFPDLVVIRQESGQFLFDILEPHDSSRNDNAAKAVGLAEFAEKHWHLFNRIQLIRKKRGADGKDHYYRLDVGKEPVRKEVLAVTNNTALDQVFDRYAISDN